MLRFQTPSTSPDYGFDRYVLPGKGRHTYVWVGPRTTVCVRTCVCESTREETVVGRLPTKILYIVDSSFFTDSRIVTEVWITEVTVYLE